MAGASTNGMSWKLSISEFESVLGANLRATFLTTRAALNGMRSRRIGRIVNISSVVAHIGGPGASHYAAAKSAIEGFTRSVALEVANRAITVNCIALGYFDKGLISHVPIEILDSIVGRVPVGRLGMADEIVPLLNYLLSEGSAFMTGQVLHLDGGLRL
jgi:NAD(P)-dependent dehydrogenase (short-subunit alcohol dehydrogenase family)